MAWLFTHLLPYSSTPFLWCPRYHGDSEQRFRLWHPGLYGTLQQYSSRICRVYLSAGSYIPGTSLNILIRYPSYVTEYSQTARSLLVVLRLTGPLRFHALSVLTQVLLNPIAFTLCELGLVKEIAERIRTSSSLSLSSSTPSSVALSVPDDRELLAAPPTSPLYLPPPLFLKVLRQVVLNPILLCTFLGLVTSLSLHRYHQPYLPPFIEMTLQQWGVVFPAAALFVMGGNMHGRGSLKDDKAYLFMVSRSGDRKSVEWRGEEGWEEAGWLVLLSRWPALPDSLQCSPTFPVPAFYSQIVLVLAGKILVLPFLAFFLVFVMGGDADLATFAFLVGAFPIGRTD